MLKRVPIDQPALTRLLSCGNFTQKQLAEVLALHPSCLSRLLKGETRTVSPLVSERLAELNRGGAAAALLAHGADSNGQRLRLFESLSRDTGFVLPAILELLVGIPAKLVDGDGCEVFLEHNGRLYLAATTRTAMKADLFSTDLPKSYTTNRDDLTAAARHARYDDEDEDEAHAYGGLTPWVCAYDYPLNLRNIRSRRERMTLARNLRNERNDVSIPVPTWSNSSNGPNDHEPRPFLAVPMRLSGGDKSRVVGVVRITTVRKDAVPFSDQAQGRLQAFANDLAEFIHAHPEWRQGGFDHYFRIWAARHDLHRLSRQVTASVTAVFGADTCSLFVRKSSHEEVFVLQDCACNEDRLDEKQREWFQRFAEHARSKSPHAPIEYRTGGLSKSSTCLKAQQAFMLCIKNGDWEVVIGPVVDVLLRSEAAPSEPVAKGDALCEMPKDLSRTIFLVPIRDSMHPRRLGGFLRIVSRDTFSEEDGRTLVGKLQHFAATLSECLAEASRQSLEQEAVKQITELGASLPPSEDPIQFAAKAIARAISADAVTIFLKGGDGKLRATAASSYLNETQLRQDYSEREVETQESNHGYFKRRSVMTQVYEAGEGKTAFTLGTLAHTRGIRVVNIRDLNDPRETQRLGIASNTPPPFAQCEIAPAGAFLSAAITLGDESSTFGAVRALRLKASPRGTFLNHHEAILASCCTILAALLRTRGRTAVVLSYSREAREELNLLEDVLTDTGYSPFFLKGDEGSGNPVELFRGLVDTGRQQYSDVLGLVILNGDEVRRRGTEVRERNEPCLNVQTELSVLVEALGPDKVLGVKERSATLPAMFDQRIQMVDFEHSQYGIATVVHKIIAALRCMKQSATV